MASHRSSWRFQRQNRPDPRGRGVVLYDFEGDLLGDDPESSLTWVGRGERVQVGGYALVDPMIWIGTQADPYHPAFEPSAIDPERDVEPDQPPRANISIHSWQPWSAMTPALRGAYLAWVAGGRRDAGAPDSFASLYLCGLERRLFLDLGISGPVEPRHDAEVRAIRDEVAALVAAYGPHLALGNAARLLAILNLVLRNAAAFTKPPMLGPDRSRVPLDLATGLGILVAAGEPIPADWALAWAWYRADMPFTAAAARCPEEVQHLFLIRYRRGEGAGIVVRPGIGELSPLYEPLNTGVPRPHITMPGLPDVFLRRGVGSKLSTYVAWACSDLEPFSRWLSRNPTRAGTMMALLHLPALLLESDLPAARRVRSWLDLTLGEYGEPIPGAVAVAAGAELLALWGQDPPDRLSKGEGEMVAQVLERFGVGMEPDVRFEGAPLTSQMPLAVFRPPDGSDGVSLREPSVMGEVAALALMLGAPLLTTDTPERVLGDEERTLLLRAILGRVPLSPLDAVRLQAAVARISPTDPKPSGLKRRIDALHPPDRARIGEVLVQIAADGASTLPPKVVALLQRHFRALRLDPAAVPSRLHAVATTAPTARRVPAARHDVPAPPRHPRAALPLDVEAISRTAQESEAVSALLGDLLTDDAGPMPAPDADAHADMAPPPSPSGPLDGLDAAHAALLRNLLRQESWPAVDAASLASSHHLLLAGAIDTINEWAIDQIDEPLVEGDDPLLIAREAARALIGT